jgi:hypothetical protein
MSHYLGQRTEQRHPKPHGDQKQCANHRRARDYRADFMADSAPAAAHNFDNTKAAPSRSSLPSTGFEHRHPRRGVRLMRPHPSRQPAPPAIPSGIATVRPPALGPGITSPDARPATDPNRIHARIDTCSPGKWSRLSGTFALMIQTQESNLLHCHQKAICCDFAQ